jgi:hypothetical protein
MVALITTTLPAHATLQGFGKETQEGVPPQICRLSRVDLKKDRDLTFKPFCSGTLIDDNLILTAAHCFAETNVKNPDVLVKAECGPHGIAKVISAPVSIEYLLAVATQKPTASLDQVVITLDTKITGITPAIRSGLDAHVEGKKIPDLTRFNCRAAGFGIAEGGELGTPHHAVITLDDLKTVDLDTESSIAIFKKQIDLPTKDPEHTSSMYEELSELLKVDIIPRLADKTRTIDPFKALQILDRFDVKVNWTVAPGDSGGSILCQDKINHKEYVYGINQSLGITKESITSLIDGGVPLEIDNRFLLML